MTKEELQLLYKINPHLRWCCVCDKLTYYAGSNTRYMIYSCPQHFSMEREFEAVEKILNIKIRARIEGAYSAQLRVFK